MNRRKSKHKEKLNIAMFGQKRIPSREGGVEIVVEELCTRMVALGHNVTCYNRGGHHVSGSEYDSKRLKEYKGIRLKTVPTIEKKGLAAVSSSFFAALCCAFGKYDIVHIHAEGPAFFAWLPKMFGKKVIVTIHGLDWQREKWKSGFGSKFIHQGEKNAVKYADEIIVLSKGVQDYFQKEYGRKTVIIPNGVNRPEVVDDDLITKDTSHFFNLTNTTAMRGFWCIIVILVHIPAVYQNRIQDLMGSFAYIGVTFFFMTSAYGLKVGAKKNPDSTKVFWRRRLPKLLMACALIIQLRNFLETAKISC